MNERHRTSRIAEVPSLTLCALSAPCPPLSRSRRCLRSTRRRLDNGLDAEVGFEEHAVNFEGRPQPLFLNTVRPQSLSFGRLQVQPLRRHLLSIYLQAGVLDMMCRRL